MIALHRLVGNLPARGHGDALLSPGFPSYAQVPLTRITQYRLPSVGMATPGSMETISDGMQMLLNIYEVHALRFGQYAVFGSRTFKPQPNMRPFNYTDMVVLTEEGAGALSCVPLETVLGFDAFVSPGAFLKISPTAAQYPAEPWPPVSYEAPAAHVDVPEAMRRALLARYWQSAASRAFRGAARTFTVCLGNEERPQALFDAAKRFLTQTILRPLPPAVSRIASMSVNVPQNSIAGLFSDSALVVVCPYTVSGNRIAPSQPDFDLRSGAFKALTPVEDDFIASILRGETPALLTDMFRRYGSVANCTDARDCTFMADYDIALMLYMIEHNLVDAHRLLNTWRQLFAYLTQCHHLNAGQAGTILAGVEETLLSLLTSSPSVRAEAFASCDDAQFQFLWSRAQTISESLFPMLRNTIAAYPEALDKSVSMLSAASPDGASDARTAAVLSAVFAAYPAPLSAEHVSLMTGQAFSQMLARLPATRQALANSIAQSDERHPQNLLVTLPLSAMLGAGADALTAALALMLRNAPSLPDLASCRHIGDVYARYADARASDLLCQFAVACLATYANDLPALLDVLCAIRPDTGAIMDAMLRAAAGAGIRLETKQCQLFFEKLLPLCGNPARIGPAYLSYESAGAQSEPGARLAHLAALRAPLAGIQADMTGPTIAILEAFGERGELLNATQSSQLADGLFTLCADKARTNKAFSLYLNRVTQKDSQYFLLHPDALSGLSGIMRITGNDMTEPLCGIFSMPIGPADVMGADQLATLVKKLLPLCRDTETVYRAFLGFVNATADVMLRQGKDSLPWFWQLISELRDFHFGARTASFVNEMTVHALRWRCRLAAGQGAALDSNAFGFLFSFSREQPSSFASSLREDVLTAYEALFTRHGNAPALLEQFDRLFPDGVPVAQHPKVRQASAQIIAKRLSAAWRSEPFFDAIAGLQPVWTNSGLSEGELLPLAQQEAEGTLQRRFACFTRIEEYSHEFQARQAQQQTAWGVLWLKALRRSLSERFDGFFRACRTASDVSALKNTAEQLGCWPAIQNTQPAVYCRFVLDVYSAIANPGTMAQLENKLTRAFHSLSEMGPGSQHISRILFHSCRKLPWDQYATPIPVLISLLCTCIPEKHTCDWDKLIGMFCPATDEMLASPFSAEGQALLCSIVAILNVLSGLQNGLANKMSQHLRSMEPYASYTERLSQNARQLARLFPAQSVGRRAVLLWLGLGE